MDRVPLLLVEDDAELRSSLRRGLAERGFVVAEAADAAATLAAVAASPPAAVVLDIGLPDADGRDVCEVLRARGFAGPVLFLTARDGLEDRISGFEAGGDDYLVKPFHLDELVVRLRAILRRAGRPAPTTAVVEAHGLRLDPGDRTVTCGDGRADLTPTEARVLGALLARAGHALPRAELARAGWSDGAIVHDNTLEQYVARLRRKLRDVGSPVGIATVRGVGYRLG
ncbi:MAG: response regulator transcription factor [Solirubrobacteraceae bacterium]|nr:response regulator transcription factor [Solirubrobacteraceae bacterium]